MGAPDEGGPPEPTPPLIEKLVRAGRWPSTHAEVISQNSRSLVDEQTIRRETGSDESRIFLEPPPFKTLAWEVERGYTDFWTKFGALHEIDAASVLVIGDFGHGSDAPFVIERHSPNRVLRLRHTGYAESQESHWVQWAESLVELLGRLGL